MAAATEQAGCWMSLMYSHVDPTLILCHVDPTLNYVSERHVNPWIYCVCVCVCGYTACMYVQRVHVSVHVSVHVCMCE